MGTKLEYAINVLAPSPNSGGFSVVEDPDHYYLQTEGLNRSFQITGLHKYQSFMSNKIPQEHNMDFIRKTMQIHEDIFKQQVRELHRLYSVQKMLMDEMKKNEKYSVKQENLRDDQSPRERSGSCSGDQTIRIMTTRGFDLERPVVNVVGAEEDLSTGVSRTGQEEGEGEGEEEGEIELTLSIGGSFKNKKLKNQEIRFSERREDFGGSGPTTPISSSSTATFDQQTKHPHWLFQGLSINRTSST